MLVADLNGDGNLDIAELTGYEVTVLLGNGDGSFRGPESFDVGYETVSFAVGDFNWDGIPDLVIGGSNEITSGPVIVLLGNGEGTFQPPQPQSESDGDQVPVADVNGTAYKTS